MPVSYTEILRYRTRLARVLSFPAVSSRSKTKPFAAKKWGRKWENIYAKYLSISPVHVQLAGSRRLLNYYYLRERIECELDKKF